MSEAAGASGGTRTRIRASGGRSIQKQLRIDGWTEMQRTTFFGTLAETCNVKLAVETAGISYSHAYYRRRVDEAFAAEWRAALTIGYDRLEEELLRLTLDALERSQTGASLIAEGEGLRPGAGLPRKAGGSPDMQMALALLNRHRATVEGSGKPARAGVRATPQETDEALRRLLDGLAKRLGSRAA